MGGGRVVGGVEGVGDGAVAGGFEGAVHDAHEPAAVKRPGQMRTVRGQIRLVVKYGWLSIK